MSCLYIVAATGLVLLSMASSVGAANFYVRAGVDVDAIGAAGLAFTSGMSAVALGYAAGAGL